MRKRYICYVDALGNRFGLKETKGWSFPIHSLGARRFAYRRTTWTAVGDVDVFVEL